VLIAEKSLTLERILSRIYIVDTWITNWDSKGTDQKGFESSESDCKKMGEQRRCQTSRFGNESNPA